MDLPSTLKPEAKVKIHLCAAATARAPHHAVSFNLSQSIFRVVFQRSNPAQLILYISYSEGYVDGFVGELTSAKRLYTTW
jgi:hypothetical protein